MFIVLNVDLRMLTSFSLFTFSFFFLFSFSSFIYLYHIYTFLSFGVWTPQLTIPKLIDRLQHWPVLPHVTVNYFRFKIFLTFEILFLIQEACYLTLFTWQHTIKILLRNELLIKEQPWAQVTHFGNGNFNVKIKKNFVLSD